MKQKIDVESYTIWIAELHSETSNSGYHKTESILAYSQIELDEAIEKYLDKNLDMFLYSKMKQERIKFIWKRKDWDLIIKNEEY